MTKSQAKSLGAKRRASEPLDDIVTLTRSFDDILQYVCLKSNGVVNPCMLVASKDTIELMRSAAGAALFIDATHAMMERGCQLVTFTLVLDGHGLGTAYGITRSKTHTAYCELFRQLRSIVGNEFQLKHAVLDSEEALHSAVRETWPLVDIHLCFFHYLQSIRRWFLQHRGYDQVSARALPSLAHSLTSSLTHTHSL